MNVQDDFFCIDLQIDVMPNRKMIGLWGSYIKYLKLKTYEEKKEFANQYFIPLPQPITRLDNLFSDLYFNFFYEAPKDMNYTLKASLELEDLLTEQYCFENNLIFCDKGVFHTIKKFIDGKFKSIRPVILKSKTKRYLVVDFDGNTHYYSYDGKCYDVHGVINPEMNYKSNI